MPQNSAPSLPRTAPASAPNGHAELPHSERFLTVTGAKEHNLQNISVELPRNELVVITGLSGSGKSSLAFDTIYAEGQRRYMETFSSYARQFMGTMERPEVEQITGLSPVISIEQKTTNRSPRSTVGTVTEIYDFLRLLYARAGTAYSYASGEPMIRYTEEQMKDQIAENYAGRKIAVLAPLIRGRKGHYRELFDQVRKQGYTKVRGGRRGAGPQGRHAGEPVQGARHRTGHRPDQDETGPPRPPRPKHANRPENGRRATVRPGRRRRRSEALLQEPHGRRKRHLLRGTEPEYIQLQQPLRLLPHLPRPGQHQ